MLPAPFHRWSWDRPGTWKTLLQRLHLDTPLLKQQNTKKLYETKTNCMQVQLGQILDPKDQKRPKNPATTFEECGAKTEVWEQKQGTVQAPCTKHQLRVSQMPKLPLQPDLWTHPYPQPI